MGNVSEKFTDDSATSSTNRPEWFDASDSNIVNVHFIKGSPERTPSSSSSARLLRFERQPNVAIPLPPGPTTTKREEEEGEGEMGNEEDDVDEKEEEEGKKTGLPTNEIVLPPTPSASTAETIATDEEEDVEGDEEEEEPTTPTNPSDLKRQKKRERKRAKQLSKEQQMERQRLQRAEAIRSREEKLRRQQAPMDGAFEVLVQGKRRSVIPFVPRSKQESTSEPPVTEPHSIFDIPEHPPVVVPFREAAPILNQRPPLPYVTMPYPNPPMMVAPPIIPFNPPRFVPIQPGYTPFPPVVPVSMQRIPMQRMMFVPQQPRMQMVPPPPPPPPQMIIHPVYPAQRPLVRPPRTPLAITAPEDRKKVEEAKKVEEVEAKIMEEHVEEVEVVEVCKTPDPRESVDPREPSDSPAPIEPRRRSSIDLNGDLITAGVAALLDDSDDIPSSTLSPPPPSLSPSTSSTSSSEMQAINRVMEFSKAESSTFDIWAGWIHEMPMAPKPIPCGMDEEFKKILEGEEEEKEEEEKKITLMSICSKMEPFFKESASKYTGVTINGEQLRSIFIEAYGGTIPRDHWKILEMVCSFQPGYFHVFDVLIGSVMEMTYQFMLTPEFKKNEDSLYRLYQSLPPVDGVDKFFQRFEDEILPELIIFISNRFLSVRTFVAITEVVKSTDLTVSDLYYLATLVFGARQFYTKFNARIKQLHIIETGGKRWIRQTTMDPLKTQSNGKEPRMTTVTDLLNKLRPHIDDILQLLPDAVVNDEEFIKAAKLVCGWNGLEEERIWKSISADRTKFQEFHEAFRPFFRIEIRMGTIYLRKLTYDDDYEPEDTVIHVDPVEKLISSMRSDEKKEKKKGVTYPAEIEFQAPDIPEEEDSEDSEDSGIHRDLWNLEKEVIRLLKRDNIPFSEFIKSENAKEMYQFLIDIFKQKDLHCLAFILERTLQETREEAWKETNALRDAAEEARLLLELAREQHRKEFGELQTRMETLSRFEAFEVEVASNSRIDGLKERIQQLTMDREAMLREEVKEERARQQRQLREMKEKHREEKRAYADEIIRLREENARLAAGHQEIAVLQEERDEMAARCENQMNAAKKMCETSSRLLLDSQKEIENLRRGAEIPIPPQIPEDHPSTSMDPPPSPPLELSPEARHQLKIMQKYYAEIDAEELRSFARGLLESYSRSQANHKERKTAEKQFKEFEEILDIVDSSINENLQMIKLNVVEDLLPIPDIPSPFSETVLNKMYYYLKEEESMDESTSSSEKFDEEDGCLICTDPIDEGDELVQCGTCAKEYHYDCISKWLKINSVCPQCSRALKDPNEYPMLE